MNSEESREPLAVEATRAPALGVCSAPGARWPVPLLALLGVSAALVALLYLDTLRTLGTLWWNDESYSHGMLVPFLSGWLAWRIARRVGPPAQGQLALGALEIAAGCLLRLCSLIVLFPPLDFLSLVLVLRGIAVALGGRAWASAFTFPILFLFFMFPLPVTWTSAVAVWLQDVVSRMSASVLDVFWTTYRRGHMLQISGVAEPLYVAEACSGLRQIMAFFALAALLGHLSRRPWPFMLLLMIAAVPAAIVANVVRVALMGAGARWFGVGWLHGPLHDSPGILTMPLGLGLVVLAAWALTKIPGLRPRVSSAPAPTTDTATIPWLAHGILILCLALGATTQWLLSVHLHAEGAARYPTLKQSLASVPKQLSAWQPGKQQGVPVSLGAWLGEAHPDSSTLPALLKFADDLSYRVYGLSRKGPFAVLYMVYSHTGEDRQHHPEICIRDVGGAPEDKRFRASVTLDADGNRIAQRFRFRTTDDRYTVVYYWHYTFDPLPDRSQSWMQVLHQRWGRRAPSVTVQVTTMATGAELAIIEKSFLPAVDRALQESVLPETARIGSDRLPIRLTASE